MTIICLSILLLINVYSITRTKSQLSFTASDIYRLRICVLDKIDSFGNADDPSAMKPLIGSIVRLVFHDCAGPLNTGFTALDINNDIRRCDGCIDLDLVDHGGLNELAVEPIEEICEEFSSQINRADCWSAVGTIALEYSASLSKKKGTLPILPYYIGRTECKYSPNAITTSETTFPVPHLGWDPLFDFFKDFFGFNSDESTALMGAHTLGRAHKSASGFHGKWTHDSFAFNNQFFIELLDKTSQWDQTEKQPSGFPQWSNMGRTPTEQELMMFNVDISLIANFEEMGADDEPFIDEDSGIVSCRWEGFNLRNNIQICPREESFGISLRYALNNQLFLDNFALVWDKLITINYDDGVLTKIIPKPFIDTRNRPFIDTINRPTQSPTKQPTQVPTKQPTQVLTKQPTQVSTKQPTQVPTKQHTQVPVLIKITEEPTPSVGGDDTLFCCIAKKQPNWNGRCWGNLNENDCMDEAPGKGTRCYWDMNNCRKEQTCTLRMETCIHNKECCSKRCRPDVKKCR